MTCRDLASCLLVAAFAEAQQAIKRLNAKTERIAPSPVNHRLPSYLIVVS
jgi:hypothetical protein